MSQLEVEGYTWLRGGVQAAKLRTLEKEIASLSQVRPCSRGLLRRSDCLRKEAVRGFGLTLPIEDPVPLRAILFDKKPDANWKLGWHQDRVLGFPQRFTAPGFENWTNKDGIPHAKPPIDFLRQVLTVRIHLDPANSDNGALRVLPGTHHDLVELASLDETRQVTLHAQPGDVLLMRPLLVHASSAVRMEATRRVLHLEYAPAGTLSRWTRLQTLASTEE